MMLRQHLFASRAMLAGTTWLWLVVFANPHSDLMLSYPHTYQLWREHGSEADWIGRLSLVTLFGFMALFRFRSFVFTRAVRVTAAAMQCGLFAAVGLMFAGTHPPQVGTAYLSPACYCAWMVWAAYRDEF